MTSATRSIQCVKTKYLNSASAEVFYSDTPQNDMSQLLPWHGIKTKCLRTAFAAAWISWAQLSGAGCGGVSLRHLPSPVQSRLEWMRTSKHHWSLLSAQLSRTGSFCGFIFRRDLTMPCAWRGVKGLCLAMLALYFSMYNGHTRNCTPKSPLQGPTLLLVTWVTVWPQCSSQKCNRNSYWFSVSSYQNCRTLSRKIQKIWAFAFLKQHPKPHLWSCHQDQVSGTSRASPSAFLQFSVSWWCVSAPCFALIHRWEPLSLLPLH